MIPLRGPAPMALAHGLAVFDAFRVVEGEIFALARRIVRMRRGLAMLGIEVREAALARLYAEAAERLGEGVVIRLVVGLGAEGLEAWAESRPVDARPVVLRRHSWPFPPPPRAAKFPHDYALARLACRGAPAGEGWMALFEYDGRLCSAAFGNVFVRMRGGWRTPPLGPGVLPGVVRAHLLAAGAAVEAPIACAELACADAIAVTNSGGFVRPVVALDGRSLDPAPADELRAALAGAPGVPR